VVVVVVVEVEVEVGVIVIVDHCPVVIIVINVVAGINDTLLLHFPIRLVVIATVRLYEITPPIYTIIRIAIKLTPTTKPIIIIQTTPHHPPSTIITPLRLLLPRIVPRYHPTLIDTSLINNLALTLIGVVLVTAVAGDGLVVDAEVLEEAVFGGVVVAIDRGGVVVVGGGVVVTAVTRIAIITTHTAPITVPVVITSTRLYTTAQPLKLHMQFGVLL